MAASKVGAITDKLAYGGAGTAISSWLVCETGWSKDEWTVFFGGIGALVALVSAGASIYFKHQHLKLARQNGRADPAA